MLCFTNEYNDSSITLMAERSFVDIIHKTTIGHFTVVCLVTWPWIGSEAGGDLVLIQTSLFSYVNAN